MNKIHQAYIRRETAICAVINMIICAGVFFAVFGGQTTVDLWGPRGLVIDCLPQGFMVGLFSVLPASLILRRRLSKGLVKTSSEMTSALPRSFIGRSILLSVLSMLGLVMAAFVLAWLTGKTAVSLHWALALKLLANALITLIVTPEALRAMLAAR